MDYLSFIVQIILVVIVFFLSRLSPGAGRMAAGQQKYSLRWNDFGANVATTFRSLHSRSVRQFIRLK